ncbi:MAG: hypothetical protein HC800_01635 [Phormidesmis sp. RL_2_1]|nr:hypothetical protein [Phormidesmis sp. RL_2_1]
MLSELAALRLTQPDNDAIAQDWSNVLGLLDLADLVTAPVLDCCQVADDSLAPQQPPL